MALEGLTSDEQQLYTGQEHFDFLREDCCVRAFIINSACQHHRLVSRICHQGKLEKLLFGHAEEEVGGSFSGLSSPTLFTYPVGRFLNRFQEQNETPSWFLCTRKPMFRRSESLD